MRNTVVHSLKLFLLSLSLFIFVPFESGAKEAPASLGKYALHSASSEGNLELVKRIVRLGVDIDLVDPFGLTPYKKCEHCVWN